MLFCLYLDDQIVPTAVDVLNVIIHSCRTKLSEASTEVMKLGILALLAATGHGFSVKSPTSSRAPTELTMTADNRRQFLRQAVLVGSGVFLPTNPADAVVYLDPAMYGDQENRVAAVDTLRERVRRAILQNPATAPSFYQLSILDALSYNSATQAGGPDGSVIKLVLSSKGTDEYTRNLQSAANTLIESAIALKKYTAITIADAVAIGGGEAIQSIGGPPLAVQLGRIEASKNAKLPDINVDLLSGNVSPDEVLKAFKRSGLTEREMTAVLGGLLTIDFVQKARSTDDWKASVKPKYKERGKMGRMSDFKRLTDEDITAMEDDDYDEDPDDGWYIADSFGTRDQAFGAKIGVGEIDEKSFNKFIKVINDAVNPKKGKSEPPENFGWIATVLANNDSPTSQAWLNKYASSNLIFLKDLNIAFNSMTQLGAEYTGGKYESLLKNKPRRSLNDDELKF